MTKNQKVLLKTKKSREKIKTKTSKANAQKKREDLALIPNVDLDFALI